jgi:hypothetical protein
VIGCALCGMRQYYTEGVLIEEEKEEKEKIP